jgi:hypothetical protein
MSKKGRSMREKSPSPPPQLAAEETEEAFGHDEPEGTITAKGNYEVLVRLFAEASPLTMSHWNPMTGEVFWLPHGQANRKATAEAFENRLFREQGWFEVPYLESDEAFGLAGSFAASLTAGRGKAEVMLALEGPKPFRALRTVLAGAPGLDRRHKRFVEAEAELRLATFCASQGLELDDPRFAIALGHAAETWGDDEEDLFEEEPQAAEKRPIGQLSIGRRRDEGRS